MRVSQDIGQRHPRAGIAALEFAIVLPFMAFLCVMIVDWARIFYYALTLENCARNGAYYASQYPGIYSYGSPREAAQADGGNIIPVLSDSDVSVLYSSSPDGPYNNPLPIPGGFVEVQVRWPFTSVTKYPGMPGTTELVRTCRMQLAPRIPKHF